MRVSRALWPALLISGACLLAGLVAGCAGATGLPHTALYVVSPNGGAPRLLVNNPDYSLWGPAWSPDGKSIVVSFGTAGGSRGELYVLNADGTSPSRPTASAMPAYS